MVGIWRYDGSWGLKLDSRNNIKTGLAVHAEINFTPDW